MSENDREPDLLDELLDAISPALPPRKKTSERKSKAALMKLLYKEALDEVRRENLAPVISLAGYIEARRAGGFAMVETFDVEEEAFFRSTGAEDSIEVFLEHEEVTDGISLPLDWGPITLKIDPVLGSGGPDHLRVSWDIALYPGAVLVLELFGYEEGEPTGPFEIMLERSASGFVFLEADELGFEPKNLLLFRLYSPNPA